MRHAEGGGLIAVIVVWENGKLGSIGPPLKSRQGLFGVYWCLVEGWDMGHIAK